ncbi:hypothetical protein CAOG_06863 [Capsaspora owczarzaki ATCC 30864]|uniref:Uncharacterized protein n=1 Tax=Capsaspora owczarzaki (strain ATCC 30864) TaxID=595528 RepID=A0A0D2WW03_CAPO3|nr:hypothetical protein CAOG_06863 [Capsaspora owczarzaki ATCC 30864]KJE96558.1 hypothetical protein CAOG_006863 [Capsaspora owczarzaki ATCC 30864]|eukprot:XP_004344484.2 hypothetical protein CAOG_06863 [Capsaspora owczarzaki ATCC 30864]
MQKYWLALLALVVPFILPPTVTRPVQPVAFQVKWNSANDDGSSRVLLYSGTASLADASLQAPAGLGSDDGTFEMLFVSIGHGGLEQGALQSGCFSLFERSSARHPFRRLDLPCFDAQPQSTSTDVLIPVEYFKQPRYASATRTGSSQPAQTSDQESQLQSSLFNVQLTVALQLTTGAESAESEPSQWILVDLCTDEHPSDLAADSEANEDAQPALSQVNRFVEHIGLPTPTAGAAGLVQSVTEQTEAAPEPLSLVAGALPLARLRAELERESERSRLLQHALHQTTASLHRSYTGLSQCQEKLQRKTTLPEVLLPAPAHHPGAVVELSHDPLDPEECNPEPVLKHLGPVRPILLFHACRQYFDQYDLTIEQTVDFLAAALVSCLAYAVIASILCAVRASLVKQLEAEAGTLRQELEEVTSHGDIQNQRAVAAAQVARTRIAELELKVELLEATLATKQQTVQSDGEPSATTGIATTALDELSELSPAQSELARGLASFVAATRSLSAALSSGAENGSIASASITSSSNLVDVTLDELQEEGQTNAPGSEDAQSILSETVQHLGGLTTEVNGESDSESVAVVAVVAEPVVARPANLDAIALTIAAGQIASEREARMNAEAQLVQTVQHSEFLQTQLDMINEFYAKARLDAQTARDDLAVKEAVFEAELESSRHELLQARVTAAQVQSQLQHQATESAIRSLDRTDDESGAFEIASLSRGSLSATAAATAIDSNGQEPHTPTAGGRSSKERILDLEQRLAASEAELSTSLDQHLTCMQQLELLTIANTRERDRHIATSIELEELRRVHQETMEQVDELRAQVTEQLDRMQFQTEETKESRAQLLADLRDSRTRAQDLAGQVAELKRHNFDLAHTLSEFQLQENGEKGGDHAAGQDELLLLEEDQQASAAAQTSAPADASLPTVIVIPESTQEAAAGPNPQHDARPDTIESLREELAHASRRIKELEFELTTAATEHNLDIDDDLERDDESEDEVVDVDDQLEEELLETYETTAPTTPQTSMSSQQSWKHGGGAVSPADLLAVNSGGRSSRRVGALAGIPLVGVSPAPGSPVPTRFPRVYDAATPQGNKLAPSVSASPYAGDSLQLSNAMQALRSRPRASSSVSTTSSIGRSIGGASTAPRPNYCHAMVQTEHFLLDEFVRRTEGKNSLLTLFDKIANGTVMQ